MFSISHDEAVEASGLSVLVANETITSFGHSLPLDVEKSAQVFEKFHLVAVVLRVILDVPLMCAQVFH